MKNVLRSPVGLMVVSEITSVSDAVAQERADNFVVIVTPKPTASPFDLAKGDLIVLLRDVDWCKKVVVPIDAISICYV